MESREARERLVRDIAHEATHGNNVPNDRPREGAPRDPREESGSRRGLLQRLKTAISSEHPAVTASAKEPVSPPAGTLDHDRARQLLVAQRSSRLPAADANALSAHLLACNPCYRFAQDLAARARQP